MSDQSPQRCGWSTIDPLMITYHDEEWGIPCHQDQALFERLILESFQAGLSWLTILRKREQFRRAFEGWTIQRIANYQTHDIERLMADTGIIRNRQKIESSIRNAQAFLTIQHDHGSFDTYLWSFVGGAPLHRPPPQTLAAIPAHTEESRRLSHDLRRRGFTFVGPTICYALMQSVGMVNDHIVGCFKAQPADTSNTAPRP